MSMEMACADCGCVVERGVIVRRCDRYPACCCEELALASTSGDPASE
jgi:hypothetical protein